MKLYIALLLVGCSFHGVAQKNISTLFSNNEARGDAMYKDLYFEQAATYYNLALKKGDSPDLKIKLADTYRELRDFENSAKYYGEVLGASGSVDPVKKYYYAQVLLSLGKLDEARQWYHTFRQEVANDSRIDDKLYLIDNFDLLYRDSSLVEINTLSFNSAFADFGSALTNGKLVFSSSRGKSTFVDPDYYREEDLLDLYAVPLDSSSDGEVEDFSKGLNTQYHEGPAAFYSGGDKIIFTRSNRHNGLTTVGSDGETKLQLFQATKTGNEWGEVRPLAMNKNEYSFAHPSLNATNDTLYFVSDIPGGYGGTDIYLCTQSNGRWTEIKNLGPTINTPGNEMYPFYIDGRLFYSSDGLGGMGGLDIYKSRIDGLTPSVPFNLGYPVNSPSDDFAYVMEAETLSGYYSSNRPGGKGEEDIYGFDITGYALTGVVIQEQNEEALQDVSLSLVENGTIVSEAVTDSEGKFFFHVPLNSDLQIKAFKEGYDFEEGVEFSTKGNPVDLDTLLIKLHLQDLFVKGIVYDNQTQAGIHDAQVILHNLTTNKMDTVITDASGRYQFPIRTKHEFKATASKYHFFPDSLEFTSFGIEKGEILNDFILDEEYIEKEVIYFDYNSFRIKRNAYSTLAKVLETMRKFPKDYLIIGAHADARGTIEHNQTLSDNRAAATVKYFTDRGIDSHRIISRGFGEAFIINRCSNGVTCHEEDHSQNRRTELTVEESLPEEELERR